MATRDQLLQQIAVVEHGLRRLSALLQEDCGNGIYVAVNFRPSFDQIIEAVAGYYGLAPCDLIDRCRAQHIVLARQVAVWVMWHLVPGASKRSIAEAIHRTRESVSHSISAIQARLDTGERRVVSDLDALCKRFGWRL